MQENLQKEPLKPKGLWFYGSFPKVGLQISRCISCIYKFFRDSSSFFEVVCYLATPLRLLRQCSCLMDYCCIPSSGLIGPCLQAPGDFLANAWFPQLTRSCGFIWGQPPIEQCSVHPGCLFDIGGFYYWINMGIIISQKNHPYRPSSIMESRRFFLWLSCFLRTGTVYKNLVSGRLGDPLSPGFGCVPWRSWKIDWRVELFFPWIRGTVFWAGFFKQRFQTNVGCAV